MIIQLLDIAPSPWSEAQRQAYEEAMDKREAKQAQKRAEKAAKKANKKAAKQEKKMEKKMKKAEKKLEKTGKKLEKQFSATSIKTITTIQEGTENYGEVHEASMPMGVIICLCASLVICLASAWFYRRSREK